MNKPKNIAIIHDWLVTMRGGEKVLEVLCELFPDATIFTLVRREGSLTPTIERMNIKTSFLQNMPFGVSNYQHYLPLFPLAIKQFDLRDFDLVISSSHAAAKSVRVRPGALHICYCYTPMRYIWDQYEQYFGKGQASMLTRMAMKLVRPYLQRWDVRTAQGVTCFVAISNNVQERIQRIYKRESDVIYPPVKTDRFSVSKQSDGYYLVVSALVPYKRVDIAVDAFTKLGKKLIVVGNGSEKQKLQSRVGSNIEFIGGASDEEVATYYAGCEALIFPGEEDFGIVPLEAMACGKPVVAFGKGGALETVVDGKTGVFFHEQTTESLADAISRLQSMQFNPVEIHEHVRQFDRTLFKNRMQEYVLSRWKEHSHGNS